MFVLTALILWTASSLFMKMDLYPGVLFWNRMMVTGMILVPFSLYIFVSVFVNNLKPIRLALISIATGFAIIVNALGLVIQNPGIVLTPMVTEGGRAFSYVEFVYSMGPMAYVLYALFFFVILLTIYKSYKHVRSGQSSYGQIGLITAGLVLLFGGSLLNISPTIGRYPFDVLATLINSFLIVIAIYKFRMLELRFMVTRGLIYSALTLTVTAVYIFAAFFIQGFFNLSLEGVSRYILFLSALLLAVAFQPLYKVSGNVVEKIFYKSEYAQGQALKNFSKNISNNLDLNQITGELFDAIKMAIPTQNVLLLLKQDEKNHYELYKTSSRVFNPSFRISKDNPIVKWMEANKTSLSRQDLYSHTTFRSMWKKEQQEISELEIDVIAPIICRNELIGMILLTKKTNNSAYLQGELDLLTYLGTSSAIAIDNARLFAKTQEEAQTDSLTNLYNHRYFCRALPEEVKKAERGEIALLLLDLDFFKLYNDLYGHVEGDRALERVAAILRKNVGNRGKICRYGGEEFVILLPEHDARKAYTIAECIRTEIEYAFLESKDVTQRFLTVSIGVCAYPGGAPNSDELLRRADLAMYTAKSKGKNQTIIYSPKDPAEGSPGSPLSEKFIKPENSATIYALAAAIDAKDHYTFGHSQRVAEYSSILSREMGMDQSHQEIIREAALLHDIGKIGVPEEVLNKKGRLDDEEFEVIKKHVEICIEIIKHISSQNHIIPAVLGHHERWDGKGYPRGLAGEAIPIGARCLAVCDAFDAMVTDRPYSKGISVSLALAEIGRNIGTQFDPQIAALFIRLVNEGVIDVEEVKAKHRSHTDPKVVGQIPLSSYYAM